MPLPHTKAEVDALIQKSSGELSDAYVSDQEFEAQGRRYFHPKMQPTEKQDLLDRYESLNAFPKMRNVPYGPPHGGFRVPWSLGSLLGEGTTYAGELPWRGQSRPKFRIGQRALGGPQAAFQNRRYGSDPHDVEGRDVEGLTSDLDALIGGAVHYGLPLVGGLGLEAAQVPGDPLLDLLLRFGARAGITNAGAYGGRKFAEMLNAPASIGALLGGAYGNSWFETQEALDILRETGRLPGGPGWETPRIPKRATWEIPNRVTIPEYEGPKLPPLRPASPMGERTDQAFRDMDWALWKQKRAVDDMMKKFPWVKDKLPKP